MPKTVINVVGARPNFLKASPLHKELSKHPGLFRSILVHTGQHYDFSMSGSFFEDLELPSPDYYLGVGSGSHAVQTARVMAGFDEMLPEVDPALVVVYGDVNSTLGCALVCAKESIPLAHVEAGLRSFDHSMPEEINRLLTDHISNYLFVSEEAGMQNLLKEGIPPDKTFLVGNIMIDSIVQNQGRFESSRILERLRLSPGAYFLMTMHRPGTVDSDRQMRRLVSIIEQITLRGRLVFPVHPRTSKNLDHFGLLQTLRSLPNLLLIDPMGYLDFLCILRGAIAVLSDSGGVQAESTFLKVPCLTFRQTTEQPATVELGTNTLVGLEERQILPLLDDILAGRGKFGQTIPLWDGRAAQRIVQVLKNNLEDQ